MSLSNCLLLSSGPLLCYAYIRIDHAIQAYRANKQFKVIYDRYWPVSERHIELTRKYFHSESKYP